MKPISAGARRQLIGAKQARARRPEKERIPAVMVFGQRRNAVTRRDVRSGQRVRDTVRPRIELSEARLAIPELNRGRTAPHLRLRRRRSEERRVGKECVSTCRSRWSLYP